jgi:magnesium chelatase subunit I
MKPTAKSASAKPAITTLGQLKASGYRSQSIKAELRKNLIQALRAGEQTFVGIHGYDQTVIPQLQNAILSGHHILLLGLRGQAKTRLARLMVNLLDEWIPVIAGSEINDDPLEPLSYFGQSTVAEHGDQTPIAWLHRSKRYAEKLATPDVTVADLIGDIDPIKASAAGLSYSDPRVIHFGMIPRAHRCLFVINELPDLQPRIQVALFNILQEGDIQIRGFQLRWPLDLQFVFTANPEDYTNRGSIVTPLKDRIGSQIMTHYPEDVSVALQITEQEAVVGNRAVEVFVPEPAKLLVEQLAMEARDHPMVDAKSGVSARMTITALENLVSAAERRALISGEQKQSVRFIDFLATIPAMTGKVELVYEGEREGPEAVAEVLLGDALKTLTPEVFPAMDKLKRTDEKNPYAAVIQWFSQGDSLEVTDTGTEADYLKALEQNAPLKALVERYAKPQNKAELAFYMEWVLWALSEHSKLNRERADRGVTFRDLFNAYLSGTTNS